MFGTNQRKADMMEMRKNGYSYREIGEAFNLSKQRVCQILNHKAVAKRKQPISVEVNRDIFAEIFQEIDLAIESNYKARRERFENMRWSRRNDDLINIIKGKIDALRGMREFIEELEKKYTEDKND